MRIALIFANDGSDVRIGKVCRSLSKLHHDVHFIGWDRSPEQKKDIDLRETHTHMLDHTTRSHRLTIAGRLLHMAFAIRVLRNLRPDAVCAVNEDTAFFLLPFKGTLYTHLVCDIFDAISDRCTRRGLLIRAAADLITKVVRNSASHLIATDSSRFEQFGVHKYKTTVIENVPEDPGEDLSKIVPSGETKIWVAGSLHRSRGLEQILQAIDNCDAVILVAGWPNDEFARDVFVKHPKVRFLGVLTAQDALRHAASCDAVFAYYAPISRNNLNASPNKLHDAMSIGRPIILNAEVRIASFISEHEIGWTCPYDAVDQLRDIILALGPHRRRLPSFSRRARSVFKHGNDWSEMEKRLAHLYSSLDRPASSSQSET
jgi:glycosyltransferase involved in cell wall biosynthesis